MAGNEDIIIEDDAIEPQETPPEEEKQQQRNDAMGLIQAIYDFITPRDLLAYSFIKKYEKLFDLSKWWHRLLYYPWVVISMITDYIFSAIVEILISLIFIAVVLSFVRGLGIVDWIMSFITK